jgi:hypothetical protein
MKNKTFSKTVKILTNTGIEIDAVLEGGKLVTDDSIYKRVKDIRGVYRITKYSDSWLNAYRPRN